MTLCLGNHHPAAIAHNGVGSGPAGGQHGLGRASRRALRRHGSCVGILLTAALLAALFAVTLAGAGLAR